jgi:hypothetical protein
MQYNQWRVQWLVQVGPGLPWNLAQKIFSTSQPIKLGPISAARQQADAELLLLLACFCVLYVSPSPSLASSSGATNGRRGELPATAASPHPALLWSPAAAPALPPS